MLQNAEKRFVTPCHASVKNEYEWPPKNSEGRLKYRFFRTDSVSQSLASSVERLAGNMF